MRRRQRAAAGADDEYRQAGVALLEFGAHRTDVHHMLRALPESVAHAVARLLVARVIEDHGQDAVADELAARARQEVALRKPGPAVLQAQADVAAAADQQ